MSSFSWPSAFFVTGTDTDVGKTIIASMLTLGLRGAYWKPIQSGLEPCTDTDTVRQVTQLPDSHFQPERFRLTQPLSPHASAAIDQVSIALSDFTLPQVTQSHLIVEGAGGLLVPINDHEYILDLIHYLGLPVCLVARSGLGTLNHTLLSLAALRGANIPILGVILNGARNASNRNTIEKYGRVRILGEVEPLETVNPPALQQAFEGLEV